MQDKIPQTSGANSDHKHSEIEHFSMLNERITGSAVALHCVKAHRQSQWRSPNFNPL